MQKPRKLQPGDKVAAITLSWGGAGKFTHRYLAGKKQLERLFEVEVVETPHALKPPHWIYKNPQARADDLMQAFEDKSIRAIISTIGGDDSIRILPYIDTSVIGRNPKIFLGFSDTTITHFACYKAGLVSFYGTSIMSGFAESGGMFPYEVAYLRKALCSSAPIGIIYPNQEGWTSEFLDWAIPQNQNSMRKLNTTEGWQFLQGKGKTEGKLLGGCLEVLEFLKGTDYWLDKREWQNAILFLETSELMPSPDHFRWALRNYAAQGILSSINGILLGRPYDNKFSGEYNQVLLQVITEEMALTGLPIITGMDFGHTSPTFTIPYGVKAEINCEAQTFSIIESALQD